VVVNMCRPGRLLVVLATAGAGVLGVCGPAEASILRGNAQGDQVALVRLLERRETPLVALTRAPERGSVRQTLTRGRNVDSEDLAVGGRGHAIAAWVVSRRTGSTDAVDRLQVALRPAGGRFSRARTLVRESVLTDPSVAVNARGDVIVVWSGYVAGQRPMLHASYRPTGGRFSPPMVLPIRSDQFAVAVDEAGVAIVAAGVKEDGPARIVASVRPPKGRFSSPQDVSGPVGDVAQRPRLAVAWPGRALLAWGWGGAVQVAERAGYGQPGGTSFGPPSVVSGGDRTSGPQSVALTFRGDALVVWAVAGQPGLVRAVLRSPPGGFSEPSTVGALSDAGEYPTYEIDAALNPRLDAAVLWKSGGEQSIALRRNGEPFRAPRAVIPRLKGTIRSSIYWPGLVLGGFGDATVAYERSDGEQVVQAVRGFDVSLSGRQRILLRQRTWGREAPSRACVPRGAKIRARTREAVVIEKRDDDDALYGCLLARGALVLLDSEFGLGTTFPPPALALAGPFAAYGLTYCDPPTGDCDTRVEVTDLRDAEAGFSNSAPAGAAKPLNPYRFETEFRLGVVRVKPNGSFAWTSCAGGNGFLCRDGEHIYVYKLEADADKAVLLDQGAEIKPSSLNLKDDRLTWINRGQERAARLG